MRRDIDLSLTKASLRITAANNVLEARTQDFYASLMLGTVDERQRCREAVHAAHEGLLDAHECHAWLLLEQRGIDPTKRHL